MVYAQCVEVAWGYVVWYFLWRKVCKRSSSLLSPKLSTSSKSRCTTHGSRIIGNTTSDSLYWWDSHMREKLMLPICSSLLYLVGGKGCSSRVKASTTHSERTKYTEDNWDFGIHQRSIWKKWWSYNIHFRSYIESCVKLSERYITYRRLPDKAIDLIWMKLVLQSSFFFI